MKNYANDTMTRTLLAGVVKVIRRARDASVKPRKKSSFGIFTALLAPIVFFAPTAAHGSGGTELTHVLSVVASSGNKSFTSIQAVEITPDGKYAVALHYSSSYITLIDLESLASTLGSDSPASSSVVMKDVALEASGNFNLGHVAFTADSSYAYIPRNDNTNWVYAVDVAEAWENVDPAPAVTRFDKGGAYARGITVSPDGTGFIINDPSYKFSHGDPLPSSATRLSNANAGTGSAKYLNAYSGEFSPGGEYLALSNLHSDVIVIVSAADNNVRKDVTGPVGATQIVFSGAGIGNTMFARAGSSGSATTVQSFSIAAGEGLPAFTPHTPLELSEQGFGLAVAPDGETIYTTGFNTGKLWAIGVAGDGGLSILQTVDDNTIDTNYQVALTPNGQHLLAAAGDEIQVFATKVKVVSFDANSGSGSMSGQSGKVSAALSSNSFTRSGYTFSGWNSAADGTGTSYADSATYDFSADLTLYAQWTAIPAAPSSAAGTAASATPASDPVSAPRVARALPAPLPVAVSAPAAVTRAPGAAADRQAVAVVGGRQVAVTAQNLGERSARFGVGKVSVDIGVSESGGRVEGTGGIPSLKIARDQAATLKGGGLQPRSVLQVFLPATDGSFIELPSVDVGVDGSFVGELTIGTSAREMPLPIGQRSIQMVGIDEDGNETVLDIPITVAQPLPSPAVNRLSGERPALEPGQLLVLTAGTPEIVDVDLVDNGANVSGDGWNIAVAGAPTETTTESLVLKRDEPVAFSGAGFMPGTRADVWLFSDPTLLGTVDIADDGTFTADFAVDSNFVPTGDHTLQVQGVGTDGYVRAASLGVMVADAGIGSSGTSEADGFIWLPITLIGASLGGLLILVAVGVAVRRRTRV